jgi:hypothetical protein
MFGLSNAQHAGATAFPGRNIQTNRPDEKPEYHPEVAFSPSDVGIWEPHQKPTEKKMPPKAAQPATSQRGWNIFG